jgi:hypothetical protein
MDRDNFMDAEDAKKFGLIDTVVKERPRSTDRDGPGPLAPSGPITV